MSDKHGQSRKWMTINTGLFGAVSLGLVAVIGFKLIQSHSNLVMMLVAIGLFLFFGLRNYLGSWKAFKDLQYTKAKAKGITSWVSGLILIIFEFLIR